MKILEEILTKKQIPAVFFHIQKTAGTSLVSMARKIYGHNIVSHADFWTKKPEELTKIGFISGHFGYAYASHLLPDRYSFTILRDPTERLISFYYFCRSREQIDYEIYQLAHNHKLADFIDICMEDPFLKMQIWNNQVWQLAHGYTPETSPNINDFEPSQLLHLAQDHLAELSYVGFTETFSDDIQFICKSLNFPTRGKNLDILRENITPQRPSKADLSKELKMKLDKMTELDQELYEYAQAKHSGARKGKWWRW